LTKEIHQQQSQPLHSAIVGLALLLGWLLAGHIFVLTELSTPVTNSLFHQAYTLFFKQLIYWKLFTLIAFIFGIRAYIYSENESSDRLFYLRSMFLLILAALLSLFSPIALGVVPLLVFGVLLFRLRKMKSMISWYGMGFLIGLIILTVWYQGLPNFNSYCFSGFQYHQTATSYNQLIIATIQNNTNQIAWLFGFLVMIIGYTIGKAKWLLEYHFHYLELRRLFLLSFALILVWGILNYFNFYRFLFNLKIGSVFYLLDTLSIQLLMVFVYLFVLIYFENFKIGLLILRFLAQTGKYWFFNLLLLFLFIFVGTTFHLSINEGLSLIVGFFGFLSASLLSYFVLAHISSKWNVF